jgi:Rieske Fe-S protein
MQPSRRFAWLVTAGLLLTGVAALGAASIGTLSPSRAVTPPYVDVPLRSIQPGSFVVVEVGDKPYAVVRLTSEMLSDLRSQTPDTWSQRPIPAGTKAILVSALVSTNLGCGLMHAPKGEPRPLHSFKWLGGFYDPCHYGEWDYAGRALRSARWLPDLSTMEYEVVGLDTLRLWHEKSSRAAVEMTSGQRRSER